MPEVTQHIEVITTNNEKIYYVFFKCMLMWLIYNTIKNVFYLMELVNAKSLWRCLKKPKLFGNPIYPHVGKIIPEIFFCFAKTTKPEKNQTSTNTKKKKKN